MSARPKSGLALRDRVPQADRGLSVDAGDTHGAGCRTGQRDPHRPIQGCLRGRMAGLDAPAFEAPDVEAVALDRRSLRPLHSPGRSRTPYGLRGLRTGVAQLAER
jgi:hypothetical protein